MSTEGAMLHAYDLRTEHRLTPLGIDERRPRFSWRLSSDEAGAAQTARRVRVETEPVLGGPGDLVWDSGWREAPGGIAVEYDGLPFAPSTRYRWQAWIRDQEGREFEAGDSWFETGLLRGPDMVRWVRRTIQPDLAIDPPSLETPSDAVRKLLPTGYFRGVFAAGADVVRARLHATAHGLYEPYLNGGRVGDH
jgi:alpha-L-rhamnosidase